MPFSIRGAGGRPSPVDLGAGRRAAASRYAAAAPVIRVARRTASNCGLRSGIGGDSTRLLDDVQPLQILLRAAVQGVLVLSLDDPGDLAGLAEVVIVDIMYRHQ